MSDDDRSDSSDWVFYRDRPEWRDVQPVPQDDGPNPVVAIAYSDRFKDVYDYFRGILRTKEKSTRALDLTKDALELNPANYTVWQFRRDILQSLNIDLTEELNYLQQVIESNAKNYQVWHHRRCIVEWKKDPSLELQLTANILNQDSKNYHAWQHRQWVIKTFGLYDKELDFVEALLFDDVRNNSAWNQRYFVVNNTTAFADMDLQFEICYTINKIKLVKNNESAWNYLRGLLFRDSKGLSGNHVVTSFCEELYKSSNRSPFLLALIIDICEDAMSKGAGDSVYNAERGLSLCKSMAEKHDKIRERYWNYIALKFTPDSDKKKATEQNSGDKPRRPSRSDSSDASHVINL